MGVQVRMTNNVEGCMKKHDRGGGGGVKNASKYHDVIYGRPLVSAQLGPILGPSWASPCGSQVEPRDRSSRALVGQPK